MTAEREVRRDKTSPVSEAQDHALKDSGLLVALEALNQLESRINQRVPRSHTNLAETLRFIIQSVAELGPNVPTGSTYQVYAFTYDHKAHRLDPESMVSIGTDDHLIREDTLHLQGLGMQAIERRIPLFSDEVDPRSTPLAHMETVACFPMIVAHEPLAVL